MNRKKFIKSTMFVAAIILMVLPILSIIFLNYYYLLTSLVERFALYQWLNQWLVPIQTQLVYQITNPFISHMQIQGNGFIINGSPIQITWNCLGWQSALLFLGSLIIGLQGNNFTWISKLQTIVLGLIGIFWVNIVRMSFTVILFANNLSIFKVVYHDYLAAVVTIIYLYIFWNFAYKLILEEK